MAEYFIDLVNGNDTTGDGSSGNPWLTMDAFYANVLETDGPHIINLAGSVTYNTPINFGSFGTGSSNRPVFIRQWAGESSAIITTSVDLHSGDANQSQNKPWQGITLINTGDFSNITNLKSSAYNCHFRKGGTVNGSAIALGFTTRSVLQNCYVSSDTGGQGRLARVTSDGWSITGCVFDGRNLTGSIRILIDDSGNRNHVISNNLFIGIKGSTGLVQMAGNTGVFTNNTVAVVGGDNGGFIVNESVSNTHVNNVYLTNRTGQAISNDTTGPPRFQGNRGFGVTALLDGASPATPHYDLGDNQILTESPYRDWENLDFMVTRPELLEVTGTGNPGIPNSFKTYAGAFRPASVADNGLNYQHILGKSMPGVGVAGYQTIYGG